MNRKQKTEKEKKTKMEFSKNANRPSAISYDVASARTHPASGRRLGQIPAAISDGSLPVAPTNEERERKYSTSICIYIYIYI